MGSLGRNMRIDEPVEAVDSARTIGVKSDAVNPAAGAIVSDVALETKRVSWSPVTLLRNDFHEGDIYERDDGSPFIENPDLLKVMRFYADHMNGTKIVNMGAGPTHFHYMVAVVARMLADKVDSIDSIRAVDISKKHLSLLGDMYCSFDSGFVAEGRSHGDHFIDGTDWRIFMTVVDYWAKHYGVSGQDILKKLHRISSNPITQNLDCLNGNMNDVDIMIEPGSLDHVNFGFCIFEESDVEVIELLKKAKGRLKPGGKLTIVDMQGFTGDDVDGHFAEDPVVEQLCPRAIDINENLVRRALKTAGFSDVNIEVYNLQAPGMEKDRGFKYLFASASNPS